MRITLISPYASISWDFTTRSLYAVLKKEGYDTRLISIPLPVGKVDIEQDDLKNIVELSDGSSLIGISVMTNFFSGIAKITNVLKKSLDVPVIWGGIHPTTRPHECLEYADMVCVGEGEEVLIDIAKAIEYRRDINHIAGLGIKSGNGILINDPRPLIENLDLLPFPDYNCAEDYLVNKGNVYKIDKDLLKHAMTMRVYSSKEKYAVYHTLTSRGCIFSCTYCCNNALNKIFHSEGRIRARSIGNVIEELLSVKRTIPFVECILINDDNFFFREREEIDYFSKEYKEKIGLPLWITGLNCGQFDKEKFSSLVDAGLRFVRMGIQSGSDRTRKMYRRFYSNQQVMDAAETISKFKNKVAPPSYDFILDNPWESESDLVESLMLLSRLPRPYVIELFSLILYPNTDLYEKAKKDGIIKNEKREIYDCSYETAKPTYLNKLFKLVIIFYQRGYFISPRVMVLLTNHSLRRLKLSYVVYNMLRLFMILLRGMELLSKGFHDILVFDFFRISKYIKKIFSIKSYTIRILNILI
ncbi:MAG: radical SAM protein [Candidatus Omnitrophica bacterium]|nr:radical SAM protein [Candidatus Omnitrophota bacterium]